MIIKISGRQLNVTPAIQLHAEAKLSKISKYVPDINSIEAIVYFDNNNSVVELNARFAGQSFKVTEKQKDMYQAITRGAKRLSEALKSKKSVLQSNRGIDGAEFEVLRHHEHLQEMKLV
jgi:putative sigma-54 modulation protein